MTIKRLIVCGIVLILVGVGAWWLYRINTPEYKVRKAVYSFAENLAVEPGEGNISSTVKTLALSNMFAPQVTVSVPEMGVTRTWSSEEIYSHIARMRQYVQYLRVEILFCDIRLNGKDKANIEIEARVAAQVNGERRVHRGEALVLNVQAVKDAQDDKWRFASCEQSRIIQR